eukprot:scaffold459_cov249-Pinguiococcus_pyrenoidosus.AAC.2
MSDDFFTKCAILNRFDERNKRPLVGVFGAFWRWRAPSALSRGGCVDGEGSEAEEQAIPVYIYDHETLRTVLPGDAMYNFTFDGYATPALGGLVKLLEYEDRHFADLELALGVRPAVERSPKFTLTENPEDAEFILISLYEQAVCFHSTMARYGSMTRTASDRMSGDAHVPTGKGARIEAMTLGPFR